MHIYFVRHGETLMNQKKAYYGALDTPLSELGKQQAADLGRQLTGITWDGVYISNKIRTLETAQAIVRGQPVETITEVEGLAELDFGQWEGLDNVSVQRKFPEAYARWCDDWLNVAPPGGECFIDFFKRVKAAFEAIVSQYTQKSGQTHLNVPEDDTHRNRNILVCAHNGTLRVIFAVMCGMGPEATWHFNFEQDAYSQVDFEYGNFTIRKINAAGARLQ